MSVSAFFTAVKSNFPFYTKSHSICLYGSQGVTPGTAQAGKPLPPFDGKMVLIDAPAIAFGLDGDNIPARLVDHRRRLRGAFSGSLLEPGAQSGDGVGQEAVWRFRWAVLGGNRLGPGPEKGFEFGSQGCRWPVAGYRRELRIGVHGQGMGRREGGRPGVAFQMIGGRRGALACAALRVPPDTGVLRASFFAYHIILILFVIIYGRARIAR